MADARMQRMRSVSGIRLSMVFAILGAASTVALAAQAARPIPTVVWAPKPLSTAEYAPPQRPWVKLADVKMKHRSEASWREVIVDDGRLSGEYIAAAPETK